MEHNNSEKQISFEIFCEIPHVRSIKILNSFNVLSTKNIVYDFNSTKSYSINKTVMYTEGSLN